MNAQSDLVRRVLELTAAIRAQADAIERAVEEADEAAREQREAEGDDRGE